MADPWRSAPLLHITRCCIVSNLNTFRVPLCSAVGFGGALIGSGLAVALIAMWGFRRGERWVWWTLLTGFVAGTLPALAVHYAIGYTTFIHLLPVYVLMMATVAALVLSRPYLTAAPPQRGPN